MILLRQFLPFPDSARMLSNEFVPLVNPNGISSGFDCELLTYILKRDTVECAIILDMKISPDGNRFLIV